MTRRLTPQELPHRVEDEREHDVAGGRRDLAVEVDVDLEVRVGIVLEVLHPLDGVPHARELLVGRDHRGAGGDLGLEQHPHVVQVAECTVARDRRVVVQLEQQRIEVVPLAGRADAIRRPWRTSTRPAGGERADHLARRRLRDAELGADVLLGRRRVVVADLAVDDPCRRSPGAPGR